VEDEAAEAEQDDGDRDGEEPLAGGHGPRSAAPPPKPVAYLYQ
jgi:hypothetical protein